MSESPIPFIKQYIYGKEALINIGNSNESTNSSTQHCSFKKNSHSTKYFAKCSFFFTNLSQGNFLNCPKFFILSKNLNAARTRTGIKQNLLH